jgi:hypothetical protein
MKIIKVIFLFYPFIINAQTSFPTSATNPLWRVEKGNFFADLYTGNYTFGNEITLCGKSYREIVSSFPPDFTRTVDCYVRNEGKKVYIVTVESWNGGALSNEKLMYDFSLEINKKIYCAAFSLENPTDSTLCWAVSTDSINYRGTKRKIWNVLYAEKISSTSIGSFPTIWVEGIGSLTHPFFPLHCISSGCESISSLVCMTELNTLKFLSPRYSSCDSLITTSSKEAISDKDVKLYPKLASHQLTVENKNVNNLNLKIINSLGQIFITKQLEIGTNTIDVTSLASGFYFALISDGHKRRVEKFVKN